jgi:transcriptional regulator with XRE-family HTH domain
MAIKFDEEGIRCKPFYASWGMLMKLARVKSGLSQIELAEKLGLHKTTISQVEGGHVQPPQTEIIRRWCEVLEINVLYHCLAAGRIPPYVQYLFATRPSATIKAIKNLEVCEPERDFFAQSDSDDDITQG